MEHYARCTKWPPGHGRCDLPATHYVMDADGYPCPGSYVCKEHGREVVAEYREKLGPWSLARCDEYGHPLKEAHQVEQPGGDWCVFWQGRKVLDGATYTVASNVVHELQGGHCGVGECREVADTIRERAKVPRPFYINRRGNDYGETVDEFETQEEAERMLSEYRMSDRAGSYRISRTPTPGWND